MRQAMLKYVLTLALLLPSTVALAQAGRIAGQVTDAATGDPLPGVNVVVQGTSQGATTGSDGYYTILNVSPGTYDVRASFVGFTPMVREGVVVNIDLTTNVDFELQEQTVGLDEVVVQAEEPIVQRDISANVANISTESIQSLPVAGVDEVIELQAGVEPGLSIRGSSQDEVAFIVDGMSTRNGRTNAPFTGLSLTAVEAVQVQTGGFNAEYGNVRSGLVNVSTKEGPRDHYDADVLLRYGPTQQQYFGITPDDPNAYYMRPFLDDEVAWEGTSNWDAYDRRQYPSFEGWNAVAARRDDLTPEQAQEVFLWQFRKPMEIEDPTYTVDGSIGGPVPVVSRSLGDLRFHASFRQDQSPYVVPQRRSAYQERMGRVKLTSDLTESMKLDLNGMFGNGLGVTNSSFGSGFQGHTPPYPWSSRGMADNLSVHGLFAMDAFYLQDVTWNTVGGDMTHVLGDNLFYEVKVQRMGTDYLTRHGPPRDTTTVRTIGGMELDEYPYGWDFEGNTEQNLTDLTVRTVHDLYDSSSTAIWSGRFDMTGQVSRYLQMKGGVEVINTTYDVDHGIFTSNLFGDRPLYEWSESPWQGAAYTQGTLDFEGLVANVGVRLDYFDAGDNWFSYSPFSRAFTADYSFDEERIVELEDVEQTSIEPQIAFSPRLGVSFPITENSKLFFNYGHFRQMLGPGNLYQVDELPVGTIEGVGNPFHPMPRTIAYELGFEQNLFNLVLLRMTGYYKDISNQPRRVSYQSIDGLVSYSRPEPYNYSDTRGFELSLSKSGGRWIRGFANYTYMVRKWGNFGVGSLFEHDLQQRQYELTTRAHYQARPVPEPFARFNLEFLTPREYGPETAGLHLLGDWHLNFLGEWRAGQVFTWTGEQTVPELENNARWRDYYDLDLRLSKGFNTDFGNVSLFADVSNVLNIRHLNRYAPFQGDRDWEYYMGSLHLPMDMFDEVENPPYEFIPGDDRPGDYRAPGAPFIPIEIIRDVSEVANPQTRPLYYQTERATSGTGTYMWYRNGSWEEADSEFVESVLENRQYIDMPNESYFHFFNPRHVLFGVRVTL